MDTLVFGKVNNENRVFLIQNMFSIIEKYISDTYVRRKVLVRIGYDLRQEVESKAHKVFSLVRKGNRGLVFSDIIKIKNIMIEELNKSSRTYTIEEIKKELGL